jgi:hypothetical protein
MAASRAPPSSVTRVSRIAPENGIAIDGADALSTALHTWASKRLIFGDRSWHGACAWARAWRL